MKIYETNGKIEEKPTLNLILLTKKKRIETHHFIFSWREER